jgi:glutamine amidotransferase
MSAGTQPVGIAVVDYKLGNLYSVVRACEHVGARAQITSDPEDIRAADAVILPGVGAFGDAMAALEALGLARLLRDMAQEKPLWGICLGMQLLMEASHEFGTHEGLGILKGEVRRLEPGSDAAARPFKVPHVGWNALRRPEGRGWAGTPLDGLPEGVFMYFVHSYAIHQAEEGVVLATTQYGGERFCSALRRGHVFATQFHPERSGEDGLAIYRNFVDAAAASRNQQG